MNRFNYKKAKAKINKCVNIKQLYDFIEEDYNDGLSLADSVWENQALEEEDRELVRCLIDKAFEFGKNAK